MQLWTALGVLLLVRLGRLEFEIRNWGGWSGNE
jgi:hypothetical protein